jgi:hypothetical protein
MQEMAMAIATIICHNTFTSDVSILHLLTTGFTGVLHGWWHNYLTEQQRLEIMNASKVHTKTTLDTKSQSITTTKVVPDTQHFVRNPQQLAYRSTEILTNLTCPNLHDFRWYKDMFLQKVMFRPDCHHAFWKKRFISELSPLCAKKVRQKLKSDWGNIVPYETLSYGQLIKYVNQVGPDLCTDLKLKAQMEQYHRNSKRN